MMKKILLLMLGALSATALSATALSAQQADIVGEVLQDQQAPRVAVPNLPGPVAAAAAVDVFNTTLWNDLESSGQLDMVSKSFYPRLVPRRPEELQPGEENLPEDPGSRGLFMAGWMLPPVQARYLVLGSLELVNERLVLNGYLYDVTAPNRAVGHVFGKAYYGSPDVDGARQIAHDFSRDILQNLGLGAGLAGTKIYFVSDRSGNKEVWVMDYDGNNQKQITNYRNLCLTPAVSADGTRLAFTTFVESLPKIYMHSLETGRRLTFYNQTASLNTTPSFHPDANRLAYASSATGRSQIYMADLDGSNLHRISYSRSLDVDPAINPRTGSQIAFTSDASGVPQIYVMDIDGANRRKVSLGGGDAVQPAWHPNGEQLAYAWTRGFEPGNYNIFISNVATGRLVQLTHGAGRNENPYFSPSGTHIAFASDRSGGTQIWTMRADGTQLRKLTTQGRNESPVWAIR